MSATRTRAASTTNGSAPENALAKARDAGDSVVTVARRMRVPAIAAGATAAGLAGGLALGSRRRKSALVSTAEALGKVAKELRSARELASGTTNDVRRIRKVLDESNRRSPIEVVLDGLTHRRGAHKAES